MRQLERVRAGKCDIEEVCIACHQVDCQVVGQHPSFFGGVCELCQVSDCVCEKRPGHYECPHLNHVTSETDTEICGTAQVQKVHLSPVVSDCSSVLAYHCLPKY